MPASVSKPPKCTQNFVIEYIILPKSFAPAGGAKISPVPQPLDTPANHLRTANEKNISAKEIFETKPAHFSKDYFIWMTDAPAEATRQKRMEESPEWIGKGKVLFLRYT